jgi:hypothetical protein
MPTFLSNLFLSFLAIFWNSNGSEILFLCRIGSTKEQKHTSDDSLGFYRHPIFMAAFLTVSC